MKSEYNYYNVQNTAYYIWGEKLNPFFQHIFIGKVNTFMKYLLHSYLCKHPSPNHHSETLLIRMSVHVIILPLI